MFSDPKKNLEQFKLEEGKFVADLGSGAGFYTIPAAKIVGHLGRVYAVDVLKDMLQKIKNHAQSAHIHNIETLWGNVEKLGGTRLADSSVDAVLICNSLFMIEDKNTFLLEVKRILRTAGRILLIDWKESFGGMGPQREHVISKEMARTLFEQAGFVFEREIEAGAHHYGFILRRV